MDDLSQLNRHGSPADPAFDRPMASQTTQYYSGIQDALSPQLVETAFSGHLIPRHMRYSGAEVGVTAVPANGNGEAGSPDRAPAFGQGPSMNTSTMGAQGTEGIMYEMPRRAYDSHDGRYARLRIELGGQVFQQEHAATQANGRILKVMPGNQAVNFGDGLREV